MEMSIIKGWIKAYLKNIDNIYNIYKNIDNKVNRNKN